MLYNTKYISLQNLKKSKLINKCYDKENIKFYMQMGFDNALISDRVHGELEAPYMHLCVSM